MKSRVERIIDLPVEKAWELFSDFSQVQHIHPLVKTVDQLSENDRGLGAMRVCNFYDGGSAKEEIVSWDEQRHTYTVNLIQGTLPLNKAAAVLSVAPYGTGKSKVSAEFDFDPKYGLFGKVMGQLVMKPKLGSILGDLLAGIEYYEEKNEDVPRNWHAPKKSIET